MLTGCGREPRTPLGKGFAEARDPRSLAPCSDPAGVRTCVCSTRRNHAGNTRKQYGVSRAGDWCGSPPNVASRVAQSARPGTLLVAASARDTVAGNPAFKWESAGSWGFKGVEDDVSLYRVRRCGPLAAGAD
ncbi:MAG: hypothetical protein NVS4B6_12730 [Mycobacterium sp.]